MNILDQILVTGGSADAESFRAPNTNSTTDLNRNSDSLLKISTGSPNHMTNSQLENAKNLINSQQQEISNL
jgi:hypothetical protein